MLWRTFTLGVVLTAAVVCSRALAEDQHFQVSTGYTHLSLNGDDSEDFSGWGLAARWRGAFFEEAPGLLLGASFQLSFYDGDDSPDGFRLVGSGQTVAVNNSISDVHIFSPTFDLAWRVPLGDKFFVEPGVGAGWAWGTFSPPVNGTTDETEDGFVLRPGVVVGYGNGEWSIGLDFQYSMYWIDFSTTVLGTSIDDLGDRHDEMYIGFFFRYSF